MFKTFKHDNDIDSIIIYIEKVFDKDKQREVLDYLNSMDDFEAGNNVFGQVPRLQKWYQTEGEYFSKSWKNKDHKRWMSKEYEDTLLKLQKNVEDITNKYIETTFNSCLINKYRDGNDNINHHRDTHTSFGIYPTIVGLSIGDDRNIEFKRVLYNDINTKSMKQDKINENDNFTLNLKSGSLLIMSGSTQKYFSHGIPGDSSKKLRYSLTFRNYI